MRPYARTRTERRRLAIELRKRIDEYRHVISEDGTRIDNLFQIIDTLKQLLELETSSDPHIMMEARRLRASIAVVPRPVGDVPPTK